MSPVVKPPSRPGKDLGKNQKPGKGAPFLGTALQGEAQPRHLFLLGGVVVALLLVLGLWQTVARGLSTPDSDQTEVNVSSPENPAGAENAVRLPPGRGAGVAGDAIPNPDPPEPGR